MSKETSKYILLAETNDFESETWYYFIKLNGNEKALKHLNKQLNTVKEPIILTGDDDDDEDSGCSLFTLDMEHPVSETTAKEMTKVEINSVMFHRKFDGALRKINFKFNPEDDDEERIIKINKRLAYGRIDKYIDKEDIDPEDINEDYESDENKSEDSDDEDNN